MEGRDLAARARCFNPDLSVSEIATAFRLQRASCSVCEEPFAFRTPEDPSHRNAHFYLQMESSESGFVLVCGQCHQEGKAILPRSLRLKAIDRGLGSRRGQHDASGHKATASNHKPQGTAARTLDPSAARRAQIRE
jgi:hypothetical protein